MAGHDWIRLASIGVLLYAAAGHARAPSEHGSMPVFQPVEAGASFRQGVASGDPGPDSVVLWTRAEPLSPHVDAVAVTLVVAADEQFHQVVLGRQLIARSGSDFTVTTRITGLAADRVYYYRFVAGNSVSRTGRTRTTPSADDPRPVTLAVVNCQDLQAGFFGAYRRMMADDAAAPANERIDLVVHLGDFIYETLNDPSQEALDGAGAPLGHPLVDRFGLPRRLTHFPDGGVTTSGLVYAATLADYRYLYRRYLEDRELQEARARWPFVYGWDDHEFSDDYWRDHANYESVGPGASDDEFSPARRLAANRAWLEYLPVRLRDLREDPQPEASPLDGEATVLRPDPLWALPVFRRLRIGGQVELLLTDTRSFRSDHAVPEDFVGTSPVLLLPRAALPESLVTTMDAGAAANGGDPPSFIDIGGIQFPNVRRFDPPGTLLGDYQKRWLQGALKESTAAWKLWANSVPLLHLRVDLSAVLPGLHDVVVSADAWDGYPSEREEMLQFLESEQIGNVVSVAGDVHAHFVGTLGAAAGKKASGPSAAPLLAEVVVAALSSNPLSVSLGGALRGGQIGSLESAVAGLVGYEAGGRHVNNLDHTLLAGASAALSAARNGVQGPTKIAAGTGPNPQLLYADTGANGYALMRFSQDAVRARLVTVEKPVREPRRGVLSVRRVAELEIPAASPGEPASLLGPAIRGELPDFYRVGDQPITGTLASPAAGGADSGH